MYQVTELSFFF